MLAIFETYEFSLFIKADENSLNLNTTSIRDVLTAEGYKGNEYKIIFRDMVAFLNEAMIIFNKSKPKK